VELALRRLEVLAELEQGEGEAAGAVAHALDVGDAGLGLDPPLVLLLQRLGQAHELAPVERRAGVAAR
jgi:hypothetical protein